MDYKKGMKFKAKVTHEVIMLVGKKGDWWNIIRVDGKKKTHKLSRQTLRRGYERTEQ